MNTKTTTSLKLRLREHYLLHEPAIRHVLEGATFVVALLLISRLLAPPAPIVPLGQIGTSQPVIVIQRESAPTLPPLPTLTPWPTPEPIVIQAPAPAPEVIYVQAPPVAAPEAPQQSEEAAPEVQAAPTPAAAVYQTMSERQQNIQQHYIDIPTRAPLQDDSVTQEWARRQWESEHCSGSGDAKVCH